MIQRTVAQWGWSVLALLLAVPTAAAGQAPAPISTSDLSALQPRSIGPAVTGGRIHDVEVEPGDPSTIYVATASGGLWKSTNRGQTWTPIFEGMGVSTFGDLALAASDPQVVYAGTGEQNNRQSTSWGNGVYRSDDGGENWRHLGLDETRHIGRVRVRPDDPDVVYVAALGNLWRSSEERGVYRSRDGGETWERVLFVDDHTGAVDLAMDPSNPDVLYAATYQRLRRTWGFNGGGPGSGIYKTTDGGDTWRELTDGLPQGDRGRIGVAVSRSNPRVLNALVQHETESGLYRSQDAGETWEMVNPRNGRPMYYSHVFIDPTDEDRVYTLSTTSYTSADGGRTQTVIADRPTYDVGVHADHHALWIDPADPRHLYLGGDGGLYESYDRGVSFRKIDNLPVSQFYAIGVDMRDPYRVLGGLQDNHSWMAPNQTRRWAGILNDDWQQIGFGDGMYWQIDPEEPRYAYGNSQNGNYTRIDTQTGDILDVRPIAPDGEERYRWDWVSPSLISRHDPATVYVGGNRLFTSHDRGVTWERSPDLTRAIDRDTLELMGVAGADIALSRNDGTSSFGEITTLAESPLDPAVLWAGTDDGNVQVSTDGGATWTERSGGLPADLDGTYVSRVVASAGEVETAWLTLDAHRDGDFEPYLFVTRDLGATWEDRSSGLPSGSANSLVEHPDNPAVLFLGTEHHLFVTTDQGLHWARVPNLPTTHYDDLVIHPREKDLVMGTHGRGIWILDDTAPLAGWNGTTAMAPVHVFGVRRGTLFHYWKDTSYRAEAQFAGANPPDGVPVTYALGPGAGEARMTVTGPDGSVVRGLVVPGGPGLHRVNWDLRHAGVEDPGAWSDTLDARLARGVDPRGPLVSPGSYTVTVSTGDASHSQAVEVGGDPLMPVTLAQYRERETFLLKVRDLMVRTRTAQDRAPTGSGDAEARTSLEEVARDLERVYESLNGRGVRQGSLYPPTAAHRERVERAERTLTRVEGTLAADGPETT